MTSRRGFLGLMAGGAVAGPGMARAAASHALGGIPIGPLTAGFANFGGSNAAMESLVSFDPKDAARRRLDEFLGRSAERLAFEKQQSRGNFLEIDDDLQSYRSFKPHFKRMIQHERNWRERQEREHDGLLKQVTGWFEKHYGDPNGEDIPF